MVLSRVLGEQWVYGFVGAVWSHTTVWPAAVHNVAWFGLAWLLVHVNDPAAGQFVFHVHHVLMLWIGAIIGRAFVSAFGSPKLIESDFVRHPWRTALFLFVGLAGVGGYLLVSLLVQPGGVPFPFQDESTGVIVISVTMAVGIIGAIGVGIRLAQTPEGRTYVKYFLNVPILILSTVVLAQPLVVVVFGLLGFYVFLYGWARVVWARDDTSFKPGKKRNRNLVRFYGWLYGFHLLAFVIANLTDHCFAGAASTAFVPGCGLEEAVSDVFLALVVYSVVAMVFLVAVICLRVSRQQDQARCSARASGARQDGQGAGACDTESPAWFGRRKARQ